MGSCFDVAIFLDGCRALSAQSGGEAIDQLLEAATHYNVRCDIITSDDVM